MADERIDITYEVLFDADPLLLADLEYLGQTGGISRSDALLRGISITDAYLKMQKSDLDPVVIQDAFSHEYINRHSIPELDQTYERNSLSSRPCRILVWPGNRAELDRIRQSRNLDTDSDAIRYAVRCSAIIAEQLQFYPGTTRLGFAAPGKWAKYELDTPYDKTLANSFRKAKARMCDWLGKQWDCVAGNDNNKISPQPKTPGKPFKPD